MLLLLAAGGVARDYCQRVKVNEEKKNYLIRDQTFM